jgi:hypothetical protein
MTVGLPHREGSTLWLLWGFLAMMPTLLEWKHIMRGKLDEDGPFDTLYPYELELREVRPVFFFRRHDEFRQAVEGN